MIVTCPGCNAKFRVKDETIPPGGAKMKCPKCATMFAARRSDDSSKSLPGDVPATTPAPQPIQYSGALAAEPAAREWDAKVSNEPARAPHDPFYDSNPQVAPPPAAAPADFITSSLASGPIRPAGPASIGPPPGETSDPFAHIDLTAPSSQPLAGGGAAAVESAVAASAAIRPAAPAAAFSAAPTAPSKPSTAAGEPPPGGSGVVIRDRNGKYTTFKYLPPARQFVAEHPDPGALEVSIGGAPYAAVKLSYAFSDLDFSRAAPAATATAAAIDGKKSSEVYPPPPPIEALGVEPGEPTLLARIGLVAAIAGVVVALLFALWQSELLPLDPYVTRAISKVTGLHSPLVLPDIDADQAAQLSQREAQAARDKGALGLAVRSYKRALLFHPGDRAVENALEECFLQLGDTDRAAEISSAARTKGASSTAPANDTKAQPATKPGSGKPDPRSRDAVKPSAPGKAPTKAGELRKSPQLIGPKPTGHR